VFRNSISLQNKNINVICLLLNNKALTWDNIQKINRWRPRKCSLYNCFDEAKLHLVMECSYFKQVWWEIESLVGLKYVV
jgi:hypothetical protein